MAFDVSLLPLQLFHLRLNSWKSISSQWETEQKDGHPLAFPASLESLIISNDEMLPNHLLGLPSSLKRLEVVIGEAPVASPIVWPRLTSLRLSAVVPPLFLNLDDLPDTLTALELLTLDMHRMQALSRDCPSPPKLPRGPKTIVFESWPVHLLSALPRSLTSLEVQFLFVDVNNETLYTKDRSFFEAFPPGLVELKVNGLASKVELSDFSTHVHPQRLAAVLPDLEILRISVLAAFPSCFIREMPPKLRQLDILLLTLEDEDAPFIPPQLTSCSIGEHGWSNPAIVQHWPVRSAANGQTAAALPKRAAKLAW